MMGVPALPNSLQADTSSSLGGERHTGELEVQVLVERGGDLALCLQHLLGTEVDVCRCQPTAAL
jgi:hypothetical protein